ncbi:nucleolar/coiled-body phosphoprotein [Wolffia australiana]
MANDDLFVGLPPPSAVIPDTPIISRTDSSSSSSCSSAGVKVPFPALKSSLKREKPPQSPAEVATQKRIRFKTTTEASEAQVIEAMNKISSHIKNPSKFSKASKLALQLIQAESVKASTSDHFFAILEAAMASPSACIDPSVRADYQALFTAAQSVSEFFSTPQKEQLVIWNIRAVVANNLYTDDSFVFSKAAGKIKDAISSLPIATEEDDVEEVLPPTEESADPFGLDALLSKDSGKNEKQKPSEIREEGDRSQKLFLKSRRESLIQCLEIAAGRYRIPWAQTVIDILAKHAFDNIQRFVSPQREAVKKLWASIRDQQIRRKQGKSVSGKLDVTAFESLQEKYSHVKISIRRAIGGSGDHRAEQWLG